MKDERNGWICSYRAIWDHPFFKGNGMRVAIWHWLLHNAAWQQTEHRVGGAKTGAKIRIERGEVCFSQQQIQDDTGASRKQVRDVIQWLIEGGKARKIGANDRANGGANVRANAKTLLAIDKYDEYQSKKLEGANEGANGRATLGPTKEQVNNITLTSSKESDDSEPISVSVVTTALWSAGKQYLASHGVKNAGSLIGRWLKKSGPTEILNAIEAAQKSGTQDPIPYITEALKNDGKPTSGNKGNELRGIIRAAASGTSGTDWG